MTMWDEIADLEMEIGEAFGVGGASWAVTRPTAATPATSPTVSAVGTRAGYAYEETSGAAQVAAPGVPVGGPVRRWYWVGATASPALAAGDILTGTGYKFQLSAPEPVAGYEKWSMERLS